MMPPRIGKAQGPEKGSHHPVGPRAVVGDRRWTRRQRTVVREDDEEEGLHGWAGDGDGDGSEDSHGWRGGRRIEYLEAKDGEREEDDRDASYYEHLIGEFFDYEEDENLFDEEEEYEEYEEEEILFTLDEYDDEAAP